MTDDPDAGWYHSRHASVGTEGSYRLGTTVQVASQTGASEGGRVRPEQVPHHGLRLVGW